MLKKTTRIFTNVKALFNYPEISSKLSRKRDLYFFFPYWSVGGAERVHIDILTLFKDLAPLCFITEKSSGSAFRQAFEQAATIVYLGRWAEKKAYKTYMLRKIAGTINQQDNAVIFGSNSRFMYDLIPLIADHVTIIDLIHNFADGEEGAEWYSIPRVPRIDKRIILGHKIKDQFRELYKKNHISPAYLDRLTIIPNKIALNTVLVKKNYSSPLQILFIARNSPEKRTSVFLKIAYLCEKRNLPFQFCLIGNFHSLTESIPSNIKLTGELHQNEALNTYYSSAHLLLLTSYREGLPLVVFEGMNFGVVPVCTNVGELSNYISAEQQNGILVENLMNEDTLAELFVEEILKMDNDRIKLKHFSENAFKTVKHRFNPDNFSASYHSVIANNHPKNTNPIENS